MWKYLLISIVLAVQITSSLTEGEEDSFSCDESDGYAVCKDSEGFLSVFQYGDGKESLSIYREGVSTIEEFSFVDVNTTTLNIFPDDTRVCTTSIIDVTPEAFTGLPLVDTVKVICVKFRGAPNPLKQLNLLDYLLLERNEFTEFPQELCADLPRLKILIVRQQQIKTLSPESFSQIAEGLMTLSLSFNELESIEPQTFARFREVRQLELQNNNLKRLRSDMFDGLDDLVTLYLDNNQLTEIEPETFSGLKNIEVIGLENNHLDNLPDGIFNNLENLQILTLRGNTISYLPLNFFEGLKNLARLSLGFSENIYIERGVFGALNKLWEVRLNADELNVLENEAFNGLATDSLILHRNHTEIDFQPNLFGGVWVYNLIIYEQNRTSIDDQVWGLSTLDNAGYPIRFESKRN